MQRVYQLASAAAEQSVLDMPVIHTKELGPLHHGLIYLIPAVVEWQRLEGFMVEINVHMKLTFSS